MAFFKRLRVLRPAVAGHDRKDARRLLQQLHQDGAAGEEFVLALAMAALAGDQDDLVQLGIGRLHLQRHAGLIVGIDVRGRRCQSPRQQASQSQGQETK